MLSDKKIIEIFSENLRRYRFSSGFSQETLAEKAGMHRTYISDLEKGRRNISLKNLEKLASVFEVETYELIVPFEKVEK